MIPTQSHRSNVSRILVERRRYAARGGAGRAGLGCGGAASLGLALLAILAALAYAGLTRDLPPVQTLEALLEPPDGALLQPSQVVDRHGVLLATVQNRAAQGRVYLRFMPPELRAEGDEGVLPESLMTATLAAGDPDFWAHPGFAIPGLHTVGRPTLAQRLASDLLLADEGASLRRELRVRLLAAQITAHYGRVKVLEWYLNSAYYGHLAYGADAAARLYFGKPAAQLDLAEAAALAAVSEAPNLNPFDAPQEALARQKAVIQAMLRYRMISPQEGIDAARERLAFRPAVADEWAYDAAGLGEYAAFWELVLQQLESDIPRRRLERGGLRVVTTLDGDLQAQAVCMLRIQQGRLGGEASAAGADCPAGRLLPTLPGQAALTALATQAEVVVLDPLSGEALALVGASPLDLAGSILPAHPAGSLSTSFVYLTAFARGFGPASLVWDIPAGEGQSAAEYHGPLRLRIAQANDYLNPAQTVLALVGAENVWRTARQLGALPADAVQPAGAAPVDALLGDVHLLAISQAFGALANQGVLVGRGADGGPANIPRQHAAGQLPALQPIAVLRVEEMGSGRIRLERSPAQTRPILTAQLAYLMSDVLSDEPARWPSLGHPNPLEIGRPAAARLASAPGGAWAIGYTPQRVAGVWLGSNEAAVGSNEAAVGGELLAQAAAGLWHALMQYAARDLPSQEWSVPAGISRMKVCDPSGMLPTRYCPNLVEEVFADGSEPLYTDTLYQAAAVNRQTQRLATVFTPPDLVEQRVFFIAPPAAQAWAGQAGLDAPPLEYDTIPLDAPAWADALMVERGMFAVLRGKVSIRGRAGGEGFSFYRLQAGAGMYPQRWLQIGGEGHTPLKNGLLAVWDTSGLNGLYAVQLLVVRADKSLRRTTLLVTLDNTPPAVEIQYPSNAAEIGLERGRIIFQVSAQDGLGLKEVVFYLDDARLANFTQPPYAPGWKATSGAHTLRVVATDLAGNTSESSVEFTVK